MKKCAEGHPVEVTSGNDYINLYHVFERMKERDKSLRGRILVRKQIDRARWRLFITDDRAAVPEAEFCKGYDPKRGRYKRYAEQLAEGTVLSFGDKAEAHKARRAWQLYVPQEKRRHLQSQIRHASKAGKYFVRVVDRS